LHIVEWEKVKFVSAAVPTTEREFVLPSQTAIISERDIERAREIRDAVVATVENRRAYVERNGVDPAFAYPAANWARTDGEVRIADRYREICRLDPELIARLRGIGQFFTGNILYESLRGHEYDALYPHRETPPFHAYSDAEVAENLATHNRVHVDRWERITRGLPIRCLYEPPHRLGEVGELRQGIIINHDTVAYQERIGLIHDTGLLAWLDERGARQGELRVLEIGGGYGALAYWFKSAFRNCSYTIVDLPECLLCSALYLSLCLPDQRASIGEVEAPRFGLRFVPNYMAQALNEEFDLVVNTLSLSEMSVPQIQTYAELIARRWLTQGGLFFEQNQDNRKVGLPNAADVLARYFAHELIGERPPDLIKGAPHLWAMRPPVLSPITRH
jgi:hypothetical protein